MKLEPTYQKEIVVQTDGTLRPFVPAFWLQRYGLQIGDKVLTYIDPRTGEYRVSPPKKPKK